MSKKKRRYEGRRTLILIGLIMLIGGGGYFALYQKEHTDQEVLASQGYKKELVRRGAVSVGIGESGTIEYGTLEQIFEIAGITEVDTGSSKSGDSSEGIPAVSGEASMGETGGTGQGSMSMANTMTGQGTGLNSTSSGEETTLEVEEVYAVSGQTLKKGDKVLKITEESIEEYREKLQTAVDSAELLVSKEEINMETKQAEADFTYQMYLTEGETAEETYNATIASLENKVADLEEDIEEEDDEEELEELKEELKIAENNLTTGSLEAKQIYENALTNYKYADQLYEIDTNGLEDDLKAAKETLAECQENLKDFESRIGDGTVYAEYSGTVTEVAYEEGDILSSGTAVVTFMDSGNVTMTVSVSQEDISSVAVGDSVTVYLTAYDGEIFEASVTGISTSSSTGSSTVDYDVTARLTGDTSKVYSGMTGEVNIAGKTEEDTLYVPNKAVHMDGAQSWVKVLNKDGTVEKTNITTGFSNGKLVAVESGLEEGQTVLIESQVTQ